MHKSIQKITVAFGLLVFCLIISSGVGRITVSAASNPPGTCFAGPGATKCSSLGLKVSKDSQGNKVDFSKYCYTVSTTSKAQTVTQVSCDKQIPTASNTTYCNDGVTPAPNNDTSKCPGADNTGGYSDGDCNNLQKCTLISKYINPLVKFLSALVGLAVVFSIIVGGIQYASSADDPSKVTAAKNRIRNSIIALVAFIFLFAMLNFLIPGGLV